MRREQKVFEAVKREDLPLVEETADVEEGGGASRIVEGTVVESTLLSGDDGSGGETSGADPYHRRRRRQGFVIAWLMWTFFLVLVLAVDKVPGVLGPLASLIPGLSSSATVTILPVQSTLSATLTLPTSALPDAAHQQFVQVRVVSVTSASLTQTAPTTGKGHIGARQARGSLTFYNAATYAQTVASGTALTGADGVQIVTDAPALLPAGNPPLFGIATVPAHSVEAGPQGNITALDLNGLCCLAGVAVKNTAAFAGGQAARDYPLVRRQDIEHIVTRLTATLLPQAHAILHAHMHVNEQPVGLPECRTGVHADHAVGEEATSVTVTLAVSCRAGVYDRWATQRIATARLAEQAEHSLGPGFALLGRVATEVTPIPAPQAQQSPLSLLVKATGVWVYQFSEAHLHRLALLIAHKDPFQAQVLLMQQPGVQSASLILVGGDGSTLPQDPSRIRIIVFPQRGGEEQHS